jgi:hypothetical protein
MKPLRYMSFLLSLLMGVNSMASTDFLLIDAFQDRDQLAGSDWQLLADGVMGGVSEGRAVLDNYQGRPCLRLNGLVSTANNGGFIQVRKKIDESLAKMAANYVGIEILVAGNNEAYNLHIKQKGLFLPWQSFRSTFTATDKWQSIKIPFQSFEAYRTSSRLKREKINQLALVAIGRDFEADVCIASIGLYR